ncbi:sensor histidine kinase [Paenibacillus mucilaginosus]|uniref:sensor histidine kinase n=1 Tax=Paenibacillus mucilaginosus TaxID=61624 RepID=UPI001F36A77D|nr:HAMP domain-containing sensor histidine kinase [Paenibacillus mucilaginosus]MCG7214928.1 HAMP domain-containing histidine kinase [Paenibacillus mucilaginosus]
MVLLNLVNVLLLNVLALAAAVMLYQLPWSEKLRRGRETQSRLMAAAVCALASLFAMAHPLQLGSWPPLDFGMIPLAVCFFYGGPLYALGAAALMLAFRFGAGGLEAWVFPVVLALVLGGLWLVRRRLRETAVLLHPLNGALLGLAVSAVMVLSGAATLLAQGIAPSWQLYALWAAYAAAHACTAGLIAYLLGQTRLRISGQQAGLPEQNTSAAAAELASSIAREVHPSLTAAKGFVQMLAGHELPESKRQAYAKLAQEEMDKAQTVIGDFVTLSRPPLADLELLDVKQAILKALETLQPYAALQKIEVLTQLQDSLIISANADHFTQCMLHLLRNGMEAMPGGGRLHIVAGRQNQTVCIDIIDEGAGMSPDEVGRLGTPLYSAGSKRSRLGMIVTYRTIQNLHGRIDVTSELGKGTCFSILLPSLPASTYH